MKTVALERMMMVMINDGDNFDKEDDTNSLKTPQVTLPSLQVVRRC